jgi:hypothetical protein
MSPRTRQQFLSLLAAGHFTEGKAPQFIATVTYLSTQSSDLPWFYISIIIALVVASWTCYLVFTAKKPEPIVEPQPNRCRKAGGIDDSDSANSKVKFSNEDSADIEKGIVLISTGSRAECYHRPECHITKNPRKGNFVERRPCLYCYGHQKHETSSDDDRE